MLERHHDWSISHRHDLDHGFGYHLNQANPLLHAVELGDSVWAFTRTLGGTYALAAELVVSARTRNSPGYRYGPYRVWGDLRRSRYVRWLSRGGGDELANLVLVCPNHHRAIHRLDAPFDHGSSGFVFGTGTEHLCTLQHELLA